MEIHMLFETIFKSHNPSMLLFKNKGKSPYNWVREVQYF